MCLALLTFPCSSSSGFMCRDVSPAAKRVSASNINTAMGMARRGRRAKKPIDGGSTGDDDIMNYLTQSEDRAGGTGGRGFEDLTHPHARHLQQRQQRSNAGSGINGTGRTKKKQERIEYKWCPIDQYGKDQIRGMQAERTMSTALCVVPADEHWDSLQRARFMARDQTYQQWPPAIRLFHPFAPRSQLPNAATAIADIIERHDIEPFQITLNRLLILPHFEVIDERLEAEAEMVRHHAPESKQARIAVEESKRKEIQREIEEESRRSAERKKKRTPWGSKSGKIKNVPDESEELQSQQQQQDSVDDDEKKNESSRSRSPSPPSLSPQELLDQQRVAQAEFNGPCVVCLEPNEESKEKIAELRDILREELFGPYDPFSVSSGVSSTSTLPRTVEKKHKKLSKGIVVSLEAGASFRPVLTLARFPSVNAAAEAAQILQAQWEPLSFEVTDLSIISRSSGDGPSDGYRRSDNDRSEVSIRRLQGTEFETESALLSTKGRFGCDALISLMGAEGVKDEAIDDGDRDVLDLLLSAGEAGGADLDLDYEALLELSDEEGQVRSRQARVRDYDDGDGDGNAFTEDWNSFLTDDDDWDEGATVVFGRTQFFMGEARQYVGMPAMSATDGKHRVLGEGVSAAARRKGAVHRKEWDEGDFGRKIKDLRPPKDY
jgi:hypothetical protein